MLIDAHAHLDRYEDTLELALEEINKHGIFTISTSMDLPSFERNRCIFERNLKKYFYPEEKQITIG